jgi:GDP-4-dehydro-6-deoxy-D-mannose reductase
VTTLVTGAAGFAGSHVVQALAATGRAAGELIAWRRATPPPAELAAIATWQQVDLLNREDVRSAIQRLKPDAVYHCAGAPNVAHSWRDTVTPLSSNILATHRLLDALRRAGSHCRIVIPGSATVYASSNAPLTEDSPIAPGNPYAVSKLAQEQLGLLAAHEDGLDVIVTRSFNHLGPRQSAAFAAPSMARQIALMENGLVDPVIKVGNLDAQRDLTDVRDMVRAYVALMKEGTPSTVYNVSSGFARSMASVLDALVARARVTVRVEADPSLLRPNDTRVVLGDSTRLRAATGWRPQIPFEQTLDDLLNYWRATSLGILRASFLQQRGGVVTLRVAPIALANGTSRSYMWPTVMLDNRNPERTLSFSSATQVPERKLQIGIRDRDQIVS